MSDTRAGKKIRALVVDDTRSSRALVVGVLETQGFACDAAETAEAAVELLGLDGAEPPEECPYDICTFDMMMPGMNGLDLLARLRERYTGPAVVMVTGVDDLEKTEQALERGADEYVLKPFSLAQLRLACGQALKRRALRLERDRAEAAREELLGLIFHDLRNPLSVVRGYLSLMQMDPGAVSAKDIATALEGCEVIVGIIDEIEDLERLEKSEGKVSVGAFDPLPVVLGVVDKWKNFVESADKRVAVTTPEHSPRVRMDRGAFARILSDLVSGSVKYAAGEHAISVRVAAGEGGRTVRVSVSDDGPSAPEAKFEAMFDKMRQGELRAGMIRRGLGLALPYAKAVCDMAGARIWAESAGMGAEGGLRIVLEIPAENGEAQRE